MPISRERCAGHPNSTMAHEPIGALPGAQKTTFRVYPNWSARHADLPGRVCRTPKTHTPVRGDWIRICVSLGGSPEKSAWQALQMGGTVLAIESHFLAPASPLIKKALHAFYRSRYKLSIHLIFSEKAFNQVGTWPPQRCPRALFGLPMTFSGPANWSARHADLPGKVRRTPK